MTSSTLDDKTIVISGIGAMTSVGHQAPVALTSIRAGISRLVSYPQYEPIVRDAAQYFPEPVITAPVTGITNKIEGIERLLALSVPSLRESLADAKLQDVDLQQVALLVAGGQRPDTKDNSRLATIFVDRLAARVCKSFFKKLQFLPMGHAGVFLALHQGIELVREGICKHCVIGGVDSWLDIETLAWLDEDQRLKSESNVDGFIPGEASAFFVIERIQDALTRGAKIYAKLGSVAIAQEQFSHRSEQGCNGEALSQCVRTVIDEMSRTGMVLSAVLCDLNGESARAKEWGHCIPRVFDKDRPQPSVLLHSADALGDVGAASGSILVGLAAYAMGMGFVDWNTVMIWGSSDEKERAACSISKWVSGQ